MLGEGLGTAGEDFYCSYKSADSKHHYTQSACCPLGIHKLLVHKFGFMGKVTLVLTIAIARHRVAM